MKLNSETRSSHQAWSATLLKKRLWHRCFPVNFAKFLRIPFLQNTSWRLLLWQCYSCSTVRILRYKFYELLTLFHSEIHCWRIIICTRNMTHDPKNIIIGLFWLLTLLVVSITFLFIKTNNNKSCNLINSWNIHLKNFKYRNVVEILNLKSELIKSLSYKISVTEGNIVFRGKRNC